MSLVEPHRPLAATPASKAAPATAPGFHYRALVPRTTGPNPWADRITLVGPPPGSGAGEFILYWMQAVRRIDGNLALEHAITMGNAHGLPVLVYESLRPDYPGASDRSHRFILEGVARQRADAERRGLRYAFFLPRTPAAARGVLRRLAARARLVVTDETPVRFLREQTASFGRRSPVPVHRVDAQGVLPLRLAGRELHAARSQRLLVERHLGVRWAPAPAIAPRRSPFTGELPFDPWDGGDPAGAAASCAIDHGVPAVPARGGRTAGLARLDAFIEQGLAGYAARRGRAADGTSGLSPYLHFGFVGVHEVVARVLASGAPDVDVDAFLEQTVVRRELAFNLCFTRHDHDRTSVLPDWARATLAAHENDPREALYPASDLAAAATADPVWNLAQRQLLVHGTIHNTLRMLWGKRIVEWTRNAAEAHRIMVELHDRYAIDGRDPNTHAGILWCLGKHDRPWFERPVFGLVRPMGSASVARKVDLAGIERALGGPAQLELLS